MPSAMRNAAARACSTTIRMERSVCGSAPYGFPESDSTFFTYG